MPRPFPASRWHAQRRVDIRGVARARHFRPAAPALLIAKAACWRHRSQPLHGEMPRPYKAAPAGSLHSRSGRYLLNGQFAVKPPFRLRARPGFSWCTQSHKASMGGASPVVAQAPGASAPLPILAIQPFAAGRCHWYGSPSQSHGRGRVMATVITSECINCGACEPECPNTAIYQGGVEWELGSAPGFARSGVFLLPCIGQSAGKRSRGLQAKR